MYLYWLAAVRIREKPQQRIKGTADNNGVLTLEYVCEDFDMDEFEFEGVDFNDFVSDMEAIVCLPAK